MYSNQNPTYSYFQNQTYVRPQAPMLKGRPVSSIEEAKAAAIDFDGSVFYFPDLANKRIYTKQINLDGTATMSMYELKEMPVPQMMSSEAAFITREEFEEALAQIRASIPAVSEVPKQNKLQF
jgi:hypothetical protein